MWYLSVNSPDLFVELFFDINIIFIIIFFSVTEQTAASMEIAFGQMAQCQHECFTYDVKQAAKIQQCLQE